MYEEYSVIEDIVNKKMRDKVHSMDEEYSVIGRRCDYHLTLSDNFLTLLAGRFQSFVDISNTI